MEEEKLPPPAEVSMPLGEAMFTQRAIRRYDGSSVDDATLKTIMQAAAKAPSGGNRQPARFIVMRQRARIQAFGGLYREAWWAKRRDENQPWTRREDIPANDKNHTAAARLADEIKDAPVVILAFTLGGRLEHSLYPTVQNLLLCARALGIGGSITTLHPTVIERLYAMFGVPADAHFHCCIPLGRPKGNFGLTRRMPVEKTTFFETWGAQNVWS